MFEAIFFDWAGTTIDFGSCAPARVFREIFRRRGVEITEAEAREPMGLAKRDHIQAIIRMPRVAALWQQTHGKSADESDVTAMYDDFLPLQKEELARGTVMIPGAVEAVACCRSLGMKIGSSTGYTRELMEVVAPMAARQGYEPDVLVCSDDVEQGRPAPLMNQHAAQSLGIEDMTNVLVVDDTAVGIEAGRRTGSPTLAFTDSGNALGLSFDDWSALGEEERTQRRRPIEAAFRKAGAEYLLPTIAELPELLRRIADGRSD